MRKSLFFVTLCLAVLAGPGCFVDVSTTNSAWPTRVRIVVTIDRQYDDLEIRWEGKLLQTLSEPGVGTVTQDSSGSGIFNSSSPPAPTFEHRFTDSARFTPGVWRFETTIRGDAGSVTIVCDEQLPPSSSWDNPRTLELKVSRMGCTSDQGLQAASIVTDFSEYATGAQPSDWTARWETANSAWTVQTNDAGKQLEGNQTVDGLRALSWNAPADQRDVEVLAKVLTHGTNAGIPSPLLVVRGKNDTLATAVAYVVGLRGGDSLVFYMIQGGLQNMTNIVYPYTYSANTWYWIRFRVSGTAAGSITLYAKVWAEGTAEPNVFTLIVAGPSVTALPDPGWAGVATADSNADPQVDMVSVSIGGTYALPRMAQTCTDQTPPYYVCR